MKKLILILSVLITFVMPSYVYADEFLSDYITGLVSSYPTNTTDVINLGTNGTCTNTLAYDNVTGDNSLRYVGSNPCNYIMFNGEKWRIIGVFEDATHGRSGEKLVKIIRDESLGNWIFDYKRNGVGSSAGTGSNDWSDSEVMMLMNPTDYLNTGLLADGTQAHNYTVVPGTGDENYIKDSKNMFRNMGSYYYGTTVYTPAQVGNNGWQSTTTASINTLQTTYKDMIAEANWHIRGISGNSNSNNATPKDFLDIEKSTGSAFNTSRAVTWTGKLGLMYVSDYGLATAGNGTTSRNTCITNTQIRSWSTNADCVNNNWLRNVATANATSDSQKTQPTQWTITPALNGSSYVYQINTNGTLNTNGTNGTSSVRPTLYLKQNVTFDGGDGSWNNPYTISTVDVYTVTYTDGVTGEEVFADQVYNNLQVNTNTPQFVGTPTRPGYTFMGWTPTISSTVTADVTYTAVWQLNSNFGDLEINKEVTGNMADVDELFELEINITKNGTGINGSYDYYVGGNLQQSQLTFVNGVATVNISSQNNILIKDIEVGDVYTITETTNGYTPTTDTITGTINSTSNIATFVNNKEQSPATGRQIDLKFAYSFIAIGPIAIILFRKNKMK